MNEGTAQPQIPLVKKLRVCYLGGIIGLFAGYLVSFFFQNEIIRMKLGFGGYLVHFFDVIIPTKENELSIALTAWICMAICSYIGQFVQLKLAEAGKIPEPKRWQKLREQEAAKRASEQGVS